MKKILAGLALSAALVAGTAVVSTPAAAAGVYVSVGDHHHHWHHWHHHHYYRHVWHRHYWHRHYWHHHYHHDMH